MVNGKISQRHAGSLFPFHFWLKQKFCLGKSPIEVKMGLAEMASCGHQPKLIVLVPRFHWSVFPWEEPLSPSRGCQAAIQICTYYWHSSCTQVSEWVSEWDTTCIQKSCHENIVWRAEREGDNMEYGHTKHVSSIPIGTLCVNAVYANAE